MNVCVLSSRVQLVQMMPGLTLICSCTATKTCHAFCQNSDQNRRGTIPCFRRYRLSLQVTSSSSALERPGSVSASSMAASGPFHRYLVVARFTLARQISAPTRKCPLQALSTLLLCCTRNVSGRALSCGLPLHALLCRKQNESTSTLTS